MHKHTVRLAVHNAQLACDDQGRPVIEFQAMELDIDPQRIIGILTEAGMSYKEAADEAAKMLDECYFRNLTRQLAERVMPVAGF